MKTLQQIKEELAEELVFPNFNSINLSESLLNLVAIRYAQEHSDYAFKQAKEIYEKSK